MTLPNNKMPKTILDLLPQLIGEVAWHLWHRVFVRAALPASSGLPNQNEGTEVEAEVEAEYDPTPQPFAESQSSAQTDWEEIL